jgi:hypothetical protein
VEGPLDTGPVIGPEGADTIDQVVQVFLGYLILVQEDLFVREPGLGSTAQIQDYL